MQQYKTYDYEMLHVVAVAVVVAINNRLGYIPQQVTRSTN